VLSVYSVKVMNKSSVIDEAAKERFIDVETQNALARGEVFKYKEAGRFRREVLTPVKHNGEPVETNILLWPSLVKEVAVEVSSNTPMPYDLASLRLHRAREMHIVKAPMLRYINFALRTDPRFKDFSPIDEFEFWRLVFVRRRRATLAELWRYVRLSSNTYQNVGLPVGATIGEIRRRIAASNGVEAPMWREFWRDLIPHVQRHGWRNLSAWLSAKRGKSEA